MPIHNAASYAMQVKHISNLSSAIDVTSSLLSIPCGFFYLALVIQPFFYITLTA